MNSPHAPPPTRALKEEQEDGTVVTKKAVPAKVKKTRAEKREKKMKFGGGAPRR